MKCWYTARDEMKYDASFAASSGIYGLLNQSQLEGGNFPSVQLGAPVPRKIDAPGQIQHGC